MKLKNFQVSRATQALHEPVLVGGIGQGGPLHDFHANFRVCRPGPWWAEDIWAVIRRDGGPDVFTLRPLPSRVYDVNPRRVYDVAYYDCTPRELFSDPESAAATAERYNAVFYQTSPKNKYLGMDLIEILKKEHEFKERYGGA